MTEDDTFNKLRRKPIDEVYNLWHEAGGIGIEALYRHMTEHHWKVEDYLNYYYDQMNINNKPKDEWISDLMKKYIIKLKELNIEI